MSELKKCKNFASCNNFVLAGSWCSACYKEFHETREELERGEEDVEEDQDQESEM